MNEIIKKANDFLTEINKNKDKYISLIKDTLDKVGRFEFIREYPEFDEIKDWVAFKENGGYYISTSSDKLDKDLYINLDLTSNELIGLLYGISNLEQE